MSDPKIRTAYQNPYWSWFVVRYGRPWPWCDRNDFTLLILPQVIKSDAMQFCWIITSKMNMRFLFTSFVSTMNIFAQGSTDRQVLGLTGPNRSEIFKILLVLVRSEIWKFFLVVLDLNWAVKKAQIFRNKTGLVFKHKREWNWTMLYYDILKVWFLHDSDVHVPNCHYYSVIIFLNYSQNKNIRRK